MTANQIKYLEHLEAKRSNQARESETARANRAQERETNRANLARESYNVASLAESARATNLLHKRESERNLETSLHNRATEAAEINKLAETNRHNVATETVEQGKLRETMTHNRATEAISRQQLSEQARSNRAQEAIASFNAIEAQRTHMANEALGTAQIIELNRHQIAVEAETRRANEEREKETRRNNTWARTNDSVFGILDASNDGKRNIANIVGSLVRAIPFSE